jgi:hypothetical protein
VWEFARARADESGIVYCQARKTAESLALALRDEGLSAVAYHAGLEPSERARNQDASQNPKKKRNKFLKKKHVLFSFHFISLLILSVTWILLLPATTSVGHSQSVTL